MNMYDLKLKFSNLVDLNYLITTQLDDLVPLSKRS